MSDGGERYRHVVWIGGATGSGKTTVAWRLATRHGLRRYRIDDFWYAHDAVLEESRLSPDQQWLALTPGEQADAFYATSARRFALVLEHLHTLPSAPPVVVEGPQVLPGLLGPGATAAFLVATPGFQEAVLRQRPLPPTADPERALRNRIEKDRLFGERIEVEATTYGHPVFRIDGTRDTAQVVEEVERALAGAPPLSVKHCGGVDFRSVRRWENEILAANVRRWVSSPDMIDGPIPPWAFACECGDAACDALVSLTLQEFDEQPRVRASGH